MSFRYHPQHMWKSDQNNPSPTAVEKRWSSLHRALSFIPSWFCLSQHLRPNRSAWIFQIRLSLTFVSNSNWKVACSIDRPAKKPVFFKINFCLRRRFLLFFRGASGAPFYVLYPYWGIWQHRLCVCRSSRSLCGASERDS